MFLLGHMCWGFVAGEASAALVRRKKPSINIQPQFLFLLAILPDFDFLLAFIGIQHRTWTHSVFLWTAAFSPLLLRYGWSHLPYYIAVIQHMLLGDSITGVSTPFWPLSNYNFSLNLDPLSIENVAAEELGLSLFLAALFLYPTIRKSFTNARTKVGSLMTIAILILVGFTFFVYYPAPILTVLINNHIISGSLNVQRIVSSIVESRLFPAEIAMHIILIISLLMIMLLRFKARRPDSIKHN